MSSYTDNIFICGVMLIFLIGCNHKIETDYIAIVEQQLYDTVHNARNSLDWEGTYRGILPCADCDGIETEIILTRQEIYTKRTRYLGKREMNTFENKGAFTWNEAGNSIKLEGFETSGSFFVAENALIHLDLEGEDFKGDFAGRNILKKVLD